MNGLKIIENPVGVLTNSPDMIWQLTNLRNYISLDNYQKEETKWEKLILNPFSQGGGSFGLPGDYTSPGRFVRATFQKKFLLLPDTKEETVVDCFHLLKTVFIPKGIVMTSRDVPDYTQYTVFMNLNTGEYYFNTYLNPEIRMVRLCDHQVADVTSLGKLKRNIQFEVLNK